MFCLICAIYMNDTVPLFIAYFGKVYYYFSPQDITDSGVTLAIVTKISKYWDFLFGYSITT